MSTNPAARLGDYVKARREELALTQLEVGDAGGPSNTKLTEIENGRLPDLTWATAKKLDKGLRWAEGSARRIWMGGEPEPLAIHGGVDLEALLIDLDKNTPGWAEGELEYFRSKLRADIAARDSGRDLKRGRN